VFTMTLFPACSNGTVLIRPPSVAEASKRWTSCEDFCKAQNAVTPAHPPPTIATRLGCVGDMTRSVRSGAMEQDHRHHGRKPKCSPQRIKGKMLMTLDSKTGSACFLTKPQKSDSTRTRACTMCALRCYPRESVRASDTDFLLIARIIHAPRFSFG
jgi:hypothetical protein